MVANAEAEYGINPIFQNLSLKESNSLKFVDSGLSQLDFLKIFQS
jgi:hypothetical protein